MGKDQESLDLSREIRQYLISKWGKVPTSVWPVDWSVKYIELSKSYGEQQRINEDKVGKAFALSGTGARHGQLSRFPQDILQFLVKFLTPEKLPDGDAGYFNNSIPTVIDPFAGHNCLPAGTKIIIPGGVKSIEDIRIGDSVLTHNGRYQKVINTFKHDNADNIYEIDIAGNPKLTITEGHPIFAIKTQQCPRDSSKGELQGACLSMCEDRTKHERYTIPCNRYYEKYEPQFIKTNEIAVNDFAGFPINNDINDIKSFRISDYIKLDSTRYEINDDYISNKNGTIIKIKNKIMVNGDFMRFCGYYVAEGTISKHGDIHIAFNKTEKEYVTDVISLFKNVFGVKATAKENKYNGCVVRVVSTPINKLLRLFFNHYAHNKHIPEFFMYLPHDKQKGFIKGYFRGDGHKSQNENAWEVCSVSINLIIQIKQILLRFNITPAIGIPTMELNGDGGKWGIIHRHQLYTIAIRGDDIHIMDSIMNKTSNIKHKHKINAFISNGIAFYKIKNIKRIKVKNTVYNIEVANDNSYTAIQCCLHNSRAEGVWRCNRNYVGWDCSAGHNIMNRKVKEMLELENTQSMIPRDAHIEFVEGDSRNINYDSRFDFSITSPPFYNLEWYGPEEAQLGKQKTYEMFLDEMQIIFNNVYRALKPNTYIAVETNDFRQNGIFHTYHSDMITMLKSAGFSMHDMIICDYGSGFLQAFISDIEANKIVSKEHSYFAIARKMPLRTEKREQVRERLANEVTAKKEAGEVDGDGNIIDTRQTKLF